jgi:hypothetical protein
MMLVVACPAELAATNQLALNHAPTVVLTAPLTGASYPAPATVTVSATATDIDGTVTIVEFYAGTTLIGSDTISPYSVTWSGVPAGSYSLTAVARDEDGASATSLAALITVTKTNQPPAVVLAAPADAATFTAPATITISATASDTDGTITTVDFYAGSMLLGSDQTSPYSTTWTDAPAGSYRLTAVAADNDGSRTTSAARTITVVAPNQAPAVSLAAPADGATYTAPATIAVSATASDGDGTIAGVDFYAGTTLIGSDTSTPYSVTWNNVPAGSYQVTAVARDNAGSATTSAARTITVNAENQAPMVSLSAPANGATYPALATITLSATASDVDGTVTVVEFYRDMTTLIGSDTTAPYEAVWTDVPAGSYQLTAVARDNASGMTVSSAILITVTEPQAPARALFTASTDHDTAVEYYVIEIYPEGATPGSANPVAAQNVGKPPVTNGECAADVRAMIESLAPGVYISTVTAFNSSGSARSAPSASFTR